MAGTAGHGKTRGAVLPPARPCLAGGAGNSRSLPPFVICPAYQKAPPPALYAVVKTSFISLASACGGSSFISLSLLPPRKLRAVFAEVPYAQPDVSTGSCFKEYITPACKSTAFFVGREFPVDNRKKYDRISACNLHAGILCDSNTLSHRRFAPVIKMSDDGVKPGMPRQSERGW